MTTPQVQSELSGPSKIKEEHRDDDEDEAELNSPDETMNGDVKQEKSFGQENNCSEKVIESRALHYGL